MPAEATLQGDRDPIVVTFPLESAGKPVSFGAGSQYDRLNEQFSRDHPGNPFAPFSSQMDWQFARWAKLRGPGSTAVSELLDIEGVQECLKLSYKNSQELNKIIDEELSGRPPFKREQIVIAGQAYDIYFRDVIKCIRALWAKPEFACILVFLPERHYLDADQNLRLFHDMRTGKWWWATQVAVEKDRPGATIAPVIISSDKTQLTLFGNKTAYPVYLTIGNLPKDIRRKPSRQGQVLLGYLPTTRLDHITNKASRRRAVANLFHGAMRRILAPLKEAGKNGVLMASGDGIVRRVHPIFAVFVGDYPEQCLVTGCYYGHCPQCPKPRDEFGEPGVEPLRNLLAILDALDKADGDPTEFARACASAGIKPIYHPFWEDLPYTNIYRSITPDLLHQMYQGVVKHLVAWLKSVYGENEIDARCRRMPPNHNTRLFTKGISSLSRVSGEEHRNICRVLLGLIVDLPLPGSLSPARLVRAVRGLLDFLHLARYQVHSSATLRLLREALDRFHANKDIFVDLGVRADFNLPKLHALEHYLASIMLFGTTDNYNTEFTERLHIDFAKDAYRASNRRDEFSQMTLWLLRKEKVLMHNSFIQWRLQGGQIVSPPRSPRLHLDVFRPRLTFQMAKHPVRTVSMSDLASLYGAADFEQAVGEFLVRYKNPALATRQVRRLAESTPLEFQRVAVFHKIKFTIPDFYDGGLPTIVDTIHARPHAHSTPARFDTALINISGTPLAPCSGIAGTRVAQVRAVFTLPAAAARSYFPTMDSPLHLAYVDWFTPFGTQPNPDHRMYSIAHSVSGRDKVRVSSVVRVSDICRSIMLFPRFGPIAPRAWSSLSVLNDCTSFYVNPFSADHTYRDVF
ncbi:hypothetical protein BOTBODRAFT_102654 [Botryobasidium botryosum FD-172 SS1]|uniref:DUF6830 domain-containing protein n=1 Tax=Botryobasidium botryosum (strain FD-172 SS1) TaxID=930990 RepID=A0A067N659_BOTB1|nr:hypothetical protein BOTBODRAFT_102654 [Botryobasidium botryosum FD-172 SS1]